MDFPELKELLGKLETERDELRLKVHLARAEAKDEWEELEKKWEKFKDRSARMMDEAGDASKDVADAGKLLLTEIRDGYRRIRKSL